MGGAEAQSASRKHPGMEEAVATWVCQVCRPAPKCLPRSINPRRQLAGVCIPGWQQPRGNATSCQEGQ